jgi:hypothetical protein
MGVDDPQNFARGLRKAHERLSDSTDVHEADRAPIKRWVRRKSNPNSTLKTYLNRLRRASECADIPLVEMNEADYHDFVFALRHDYEFADSTVSNFEAVVLPFLEDMRDIDWSEDVERTKPDTTPPAPDTMLTPADIQTLTKTANHQRDVAFIEFLADTGARLSLALSLRVRDVDLSEPATYRPNPDAVGLKGADIQEYPLIDSAAGLRAYLRTSHPRPDMPDAALFHKIKPAARGENGEQWTDDGGVVPNAMRQQIARIADRGGVDKPANPHAFRHAAITRMVREGYTRSQIERARHRGRTQ